MSNGSEGAISPLVRSFIKGTFDKRGLKNESERIHYHALSTGCHFSETLTNSEKLKEKVKVFILKK